MENYLGIEIDYNRDKTLPEKGLTMLTKKGFYKKSHETSPQQSFARAATCYCFGDYGLAQRIYDAVSKGWFMYASPVLSNANEVHWPTFDNSQFNEASDWLVNNVIATALPISCFAAGTPVYTNNGIKSIEKIVEGDMVLTHKGRFKKVLATRKSQSSDIYELDGSANKTKVKVTGNHLMYTNSGWKEVSKLVCGYDLIANSHYVELHEKTPMLHFEQIEKKAYNQTSYVADKLKIVDVELNNELAWAFGFWFAEGSTCDNGSIRVTNQSIDLCDKWIHIMSKYLSIQGKSFKNKQGNWCNGEICSVILQRNFDMIFGKGCYDKKLPLDWLDMPSGIFESFFEGFYAGDGFQTKETRMFELANPELCSQIVLLLMKHGYTVNTQYKKYAPYNKTLDNHIYNGVVALCEKMKKSGVRNGVVMPDGLRYSTIRNVAKLDIGLIDVYDIQVEEDESFSVGGLIAHNCYLQFIPDTKEGLVNSASEVRWLSMMGGGVGIYTSNRSPDDKSTGVMAHLRGYDADTLAYKQQESRRGSIAAYLDITHPEIKSFLSMRNPVGGDPNKKLFNLNNAVNLSDSFMESVINGTEYELVDPKHGKTGKTMSARDVWEEIIDMRFETGEPYIHWVDTVNSRLPKRITNPNYKVTQSNLCSEIELMTDASRTAVCCLSSLNLEKYEEWKDTTLVQDLIRFLDNVLEYFIRLAPKDKMARAIYSAKMERALGLGTFGWHSFLQSKNIPFESGGVNSAASWTHRLYSNILEKAESESKKMAIERGESPDCTGSGFRNSHLLAVAPNASSSEILGSSPSIEPYAGNAFNSQGRAGSFLIKNKYLEKHLDSIGYNTDEVWLSIIENDGSVQHLSFLDDHTKKVFKIAYEIDPMWVVELAAIRQDYICQSQSVNLFVPNDITKEEMSDIHMMAWKKKLKTLYYCRTKAAVKANIGTGGEMPLNAIPIRQKIEYDETVCRSCEG